MPFAIIFLTLKLKYKVTTLRSSKLHLEVALSPLISYPCRNCGLGSQIE